MSHFFATRIDAQPKSDEMPVLEHHVGSRIQPTRQTEDSDIPSTFRSFIADMDDLKLRHFIIQRQSGSGGSPKCVRLTRAMYGNLAKSL